MFLARVIGVTARVFGGSNGALLQQAIVILLAIMKAMKTGSTQAVTRLAYDRLPKDWKYPDGPLTEPELVDLVESGKEFVVKLRACLIK